jgi:hypothetical protein
MTLKVANSRFESRQFVTEVTEPEVAPLAEKATNALATALVPRWAARVVVIDMRLG